MLFGGSSWEARIFVAQVGYPLANGREDPIECISPDRSTTLAVVSISPEENEEVGELVFLRRDITEGSGLVVELAELAP